MLLDTKRRKLFYGLFIKKQYDLSQAEVRILKYMSDKNMHSPEDIVKNCRIQSIGAVRAQICRLKHKGVDFEVLRGAGYKLRTEIRINGD